MAGRSDYTAAPVREQMSSFMLSPMSSPKPSLAMGGVRCLSLTVIAMAACLSCGSEPESNEQGEMATHAAAVVPVVAGFVDVAIAAGVDFVHTHGAYGRKLLFETMGSGVALADFDGDERPDMLLLQSGTLPGSEFTADELRRAEHDTGTTHGLFLNRTVPGGRWRFDDATEGSGLQEPMYAMGGAVADVDADGDRDLWIGAYGRDRFFLNDGAAHFTEATESAGLEDRRWTIGGAFFDADLDGDLDLFTVGYLDMSIASNHRCGPTPEQRTYCHVDTWGGVDDRLYFNDGAGHFTDVSAGAGLVGLAGKGLAIVVGDTDDDGDADLFIANDSTANFFLRNDGEGHFSDASRRSALDVNGDGRTEACMGTDLGDLDGDGDLDLYVVNFEQETNTLYRNDGDGFFTDVSNHSGAGSASRPMLGFGTVFLDADNDSDLDMYVANGHIDSNVAEFSATATYAQVDQLALNDGRGRFSVAGPERGTSLSEPRVGRAVARADLDGDGDSDLVVTNSNGRPWVLRNDMAVGHRLVLRLLGPGGRADAEGARVEVTVAEAGAEQRTLVRELAGGGSYESHSDTTLVIGLGSADTIEQLLIRWPGGAVSKLGSQPVDHRLTVAFAGAVLAAEILPEASR
ncbi:MAG: hypothetical protein ACI9EF_000534 [Pseudohongiellaceae bacterium]